MKRLLITSLLGLSAMTVLAISPANAGNLTQQGLDDPHVTAPMVEPVPCVIFTKHINHISGKLQRPDCTWKRPNRTSKKTPPKPERCYKTIEFKGGGVGLVPCDHVLGEGESE